MTASRKTDNHDPRAKLDLRRHFMSKYHADGSARVLDCCMGSGWIWRELRKEYRVASYLGLDVKPRKGRLKIDSARYLEAGGWAHDVVDIDTYGSPWKHWVNLLATVRGDVTAFLTVGLVTMGGGSDLSDAEASAMGLSGVHVPAAIGQSLKRGFSASYCLTSCYDLGILIDEAIEAESKGNARYIGVRLKRWPEKEQHEPDL